jgi:hypothetical protein
LRFRPELVAKSIDETITALAKIACLAGNFRACSQNPVFNPLMRRDVHDVKWE